MPPILRSHAKKPIPSKHLSQFTRGRIFGLHEAQMGSEQISHYLNIPPITVRRTIAKGYQEGEHQQKNHLALHLSPLTLCAGRSRRL